MELQRHTTCWRTASVGGVGIGTWGGVWGCLRYQRGCVESALESRERGGDRQNLRMYQDYCQQCLTAKGLHFYTLQFYKRLNGRKGTCELGCGLKNQCLKKLALTLTIGISHMIVKGP